MVNNIGGLLALLLLLLFDQQHAPAVAVVVCDEVAQRFDDVVLLDGLHRLFDLKAQVPQHHGGLARALEVVGQAEDVRHEGNAVAVFVCHRCDVRRFEGELLQLGEGGEQHLMVDGHNIKLLFDGRQDVADSAACKVVGVGLQGGWDVRKGCGAVDRPLDGGGGCL